MIDKDLAAEMDELAPVAEQLEALELENTQEQKL